MPNDVLAVTWTEPPINGRKLITSYFALGDKLYYDGRKLTISDEYGPKYYRTEVREITIVQAQSISRL